jgi:hypothetical protein
MQPLDVFTRAYDTAVANLDRWVDAQTDVARVEREHASYHPPSMPRRSN